MYVICSADRPESVVKLLKTNTEHETPELEKAWAKILGASQKLGKLIGQFNTVQQLQEVSKDNKEKMKKDGLEAHKDNLMLLLL